MPAKRKSTPRSTAVPLEKIAAVAKQPPLNGLGWDPRNTQYIADEKELERIMKDDLFTVQHASMVRPTVILGYELREVGALANAKTRANMRIVKLTKVKAEAEPA